MSLLWLIVGTFLQLGLTSFMMLGAIFGGGALAQGYELSERDDRVLTSAIFVLPIAAFAGAVIVLIGYWNDCSASIYWCYGLPWILAACYIGYIKRFVINGK